MVCVGGLIQLNIGEASNVHVVLGIYVRATRPIQLNDKYGTRRYIKQRGQLGVTLHQNVLTALDHQALRYQNNKSYEELEDERLLDEAIDETGSVPCPNAGGDEES